MAYNGQLKNWSEVPATSNVNINDFDISNVNVLDAIEVMAGSVVSVGLTSGNITVTNLTDLSGNIKILNEDDQAPNYMQAISGNLYFNNQLLAQANDIQDIADWSLYPALQNINADNHGIDFTRYIDFGIGNRLETDVPGNLTYKGNVILTTASPTTGVQALNTLNGNLTLLSTNPATLTVDTYSANGTITLTVPATAAGVSTLNTLNGAVNITSTDVATLTVAQVGQDIQLTVPATAVGVSTLNTLTGAVNITSTDVATLTVAQVGQDIQLTVPATAVGVSTLNTLTGAVNITSTNVATLTVAQVGQDVQLTVPPSAVPAPVDWANYPAINDVSIPDQDLNMTTTTPGVAYNKATLNADVDIGTLANAPFRPDFNAYCGTVTFGGITSPLTSMTINSLGPVNVNSAAGISLAGGGGVSVAGAGGVSVTGAGVVSVAGGGISVNGGAVNLTSTSALNVAAGGIAVNGGGIAINGGGVAVNAGALTIASGTVGVGTVAAAGGGVNVFGSDLILIPVGPATSTLRTNLITSQSGTPTLAISNVSTINGAAYPPPSVTTYNTYTLSGSTISGVVANPKGIGTGNQWNLGTWYLISTIQINTPPNFTSLQSVYFDGFGYFDFDSALNTYWCIFYVTSTQATEQSLIGQKDINNAIYGGNGQAQTYLPLNLTIPPTYVTSGGTITIRIYGYATSNNHYLSTLPNISGRVGLELP
jgi:hypothetical protein